MNFAFFFWVGIDTSYVQKADPLNFICMNEEHMKHRNNKYIVKDPP